MPSSPVVSITKSKIPGFISRVQGLLDQNPRAERAILVNSQAIIDNTTFLLGIFDTHWARIVGFVSSDPSLSDAGISMDMPHDEIMGRLNGLAADHADARIRETAENSLWCLRKIELEANRIALNLEMPEEAWFAYWMTGELLNDGIKSIGAATPAIWFKFYDMAFSYLNNKAADQNSGIQSKRMAWFLKECLKNEPVSDSLDLSPFLMKSVYCYWDRTNPLWMRLVEQAKKLYERIYSDSPEKSARLLQTFREFMTEGRYADFYFLSVRPYSKTVKDVLTRNTRTGVNIENVIFSLRFSRIETEWSENAEYVGAMNVHPDYQWIGLLAFLQEAIAERFSESWNKSEKWAVGMIGIDGQIDRNGAFPEKEPVDVLYAHTVKWSSAARLWRRMGFEPTGKEDAFLEDGKMVTREEIRISRDRCLKKETRQCSAPIGNS